MRSARLLTVAWLVVPGAARASDNPGLDGFVLAALPPPLDFFSLTPCRVVDTRLAGGSPLVAGVERTFPFAGVCGIPSTAAAVSINVAVTQPTAAGNVRFYPAGSSVPTVSTINYSAGQTRTNNAIVGLGAAGELAVQNRPAGSTHLIVDVNGYFEGACPTPTRTCYTGPAGTPGVGSCSLGTQTCIDGAYGPCIGEVTPSAESCNGVDDDCNGLADDGLGTFTCGLGACQVTVPACVAGALGMCVPGPPAAANDATCNGVDDDCDGAIDEDCAMCVRVAPTGIDAQAIADNNITPFQTLQAAINWSAAVPARPKRVCVAAGLACGLTGTYTGAVTMASGISVYGGYQSSNWTRCATSTTVLNPLAPQGVLFPAAVTAQTAFDGFRIDRATATTTAAVTVDGARNVILSGLIISNTPTVTNSYGINLVSGAEATITRSSIFAGNGTAQSIGIRSNASRVTIRANCLSLNPLNGHCDDFCGSAGPAIRGRYVPGTGETYAVLLEDSAGSVVEASALCGNDADRGAGLRITGSSTGIVVRANLIQAFGGLVDSHGIWLEECGGAAPWVVDNEYIASTGDDAATRSAAIFSVGDCRPVIDRNMFITGGGEGVASAGNGVHCAMGASAASACVITGNANIRGAAFGFPPSAAGVRCDDGACARIERNAISGGSGVDTAGVVLGATGAFVNANVIQAGCATSSGIGLLAVDSFARIQNNQISGAASVGACTTTPPASYAVKAFVGSGANEIDLHSNDLFAEGFAGTCTSRGIAFDVSGSPPLGPRGIVRNNIVLAGKCGQSFGVDEMSAQADPRVLQNNDLWQNAFVTALYRNENSTNLTTIASVNALSDITASGNISADPLYTGGHLSAGSPARNAGIATGAPNHDFEGDPRPQESFFDIGRDEIVPAVVRINEINANIANSCDLIELRVVSGGSMGGYRLQERSNQTLVTFAPGFYVTTNDIIVVHLNSLSATCNPNGATQEISVPYEQPAAAFAGNYDVAFDWWSGDTGLAATDNVVTLYDAGNIMDAVFVTDDPTGAAAADTEAQAAVVAAAGQWQMVGGGVPPGGFVGNDFNAHAALDLDATGTTATGTTIQRLDNTDEDDKNDWNIGGLTTQTQTWGLLNAGQSPF